MDMGSTGGAISTILDLDVVRADLGMAVAFSSFIDTWFDAIGVPVSQCTCCTSLAGFSSIFFLAFIRSVTTDT